MRDFLTATVSMWQALTFIAVVTVVALWVDRRNTVRTRDAIQRERAGRRRDIAQLRQEYRAGAPRRRGQDLPPLPHPSYARGGVVLPENVVELRKGPRP